MNPMEAQRFVHFGRWLYLLAGSILGTAAILPMAGDGLLLAQWLPSPDFLLFLLALAIMAQSVLGVSQDILQARPELVGFYLRGYLVTGLGYLLLATMVLLSKLNLSSSL
jgi:hypothetical protein